MNLHNAFPEEYSEHCGNFERRTQDHEKSWLKITIFVIVSVIFIDSLANIAHLKSINESPYHTRTNQIASSKGASSETVNVQLAPSKDNTLYEDASGNISNGAGDYLFAGTTATAASGAIRRGVIAFDIAGSIPAGPTSRPQPRTAPRPCDF